MALVKEPVSIQRGGKPLQGRLQYGVCYGGYAKAPRPFQVVFQAVRAGA